MKYKILLRKLPIDEYARELFYDTFNSNFNSSLYVTYLLFNIYPKSSVYLISNTKLEALVSIPTPDYIFMEELEKYNLLSIIERNKDESVK
jgi:hypothetical protein